MSLFSTHKIKIQVATVVKGSAGGSTRTWSDVLTLPCSVQSSDGRQGMQYMSNNVVADYAVYLESNPGNLSVDHRIEVTSGPSYVGYMLNVVGPVKDMGGRGKKFAIYCKRTT